MALLFDMFGVFFLPRFRSSSQKFHKNGTVLISLSQSVAQVLQTSITQNCCPVDDKLFFTS